MAFIATTLHKLLKHNHVFVLDDHETAAYFQNDVETLTHSPDIFLFPDSFKKSGKPGALNQSHVMLRTESMLKWNQSPISNKKVLVTYPEAIMEKVVSKDVFRKNTILIKQNEKIDRNFLSELLIDLKFQRTDFVYQPGQFAIRGGIMDIYSYGNEHPYRIELFDDEVETIKIFNPETQLSIRRLLQVTIIPNIESQVNPQQKIALFDVLSENTIVWIHDAEFMIERCRKMLQEVQTTQALPTEDSESNDTPYTEEDFCTPDDLVKQLEKGIL
jgi:Transcription-repair coupling factor (superfamily II helicase)